MDQLTALKPDSLDDVQKVLFFLKMPTYIRDVVNSWDCPTTSRSAAIKFGSTTTSMVASRSAPFSPADFYPTLNPPWQRQCLSYLQNIRFSPTIYIKIFGSW
jgi:hypothetical protein